MPKIHDIAWRRLLRHWHRRAGAFSALILLPIAMTGIPLNHAEFLGLNQHSTPAFLARLVGHQVLAPNQAYAANPNLLVSHCERHIYLNDQPLIAAGSAVVGAEFIQGLLIIAEANKLHLFDASSHELIESIQAESLPAAMTGLSTVGNALWLHTSTGIYEANEEYLQFQAVKDVAERPRQPLSIDKKLAEAIAHKELGSSLSWTSFLTILHSGQIFGSLGRYLSDLAGLALIYLAFSGSWLWFRAARRHGA